MILSRTAIYALRMLTLLGRAAPAENLTAASLSRAASVPRHYVNKVMQQLIAAGIVSATRGQGGGFQLARPPHRVRFADVLDAVNMDLEIGQCVFRPGPCRMKDPCVLHGAWNELQAKVEDWAQRTTLADLDTTSP